MPEESIDIIINVGSGADDKGEMRSRLSEFFCRQVVATRASRWPEAVPEVVELARRPALSDSNTIVAGGGDGTLNAVASAVVGTRRHFGVSPLGNLHPFRQGLAYPARS